MWCHFPQEERDLTLEALNDYLGEYARWVKPRGGLFIWVSLPETMDTLRLEELAKQKGVRYDPGRMFSTQLKEVKGLRLSYAHMPEDEIPKGIKVLADCVSATQQPRQMWWPTSTSGRVRAAGQ